ncbi:MAG TPA: phosphatidylglycerol lysyltransferase domain-containing protein [Longimicrobiales bacterium]|nr:phosphatidylglycerol lysyltransferase domain-containing protein [Longimicrobiales bacterium]
MPLVSVLAPIWPRPRSGYEDAPGVPAPDAGPLPPTVHSIAVGSPSPDARRALTGESSLLVDVLGRGFLPVRTHLGCLVAEGDPVLRPGSGSSWHLIRAFLDLARASGRFPVLREVSPEMADQYRRMGLRIRRTGIRSRVPLDHVDPGSDVHSPVLRAAAEAETRGLRAEILSEGRALTQLAALARVSPRLDAASLQGASVILIRDGHQVVAWARLWTGEQGGEVRLDRVRTGEALRAGPIDLLLAEALQWSRGVGAISLVLPDAGPGQHDAWRRLSDSVPLVHEPRYTASPRGLRGRLASILVRLRTPGLILPV